MLFFVVVRTQVFAEKCRFKVAARRGSIAQCRRKHASATHAFAAAAGREEQHLLGEGSGGRAYSLPLVTACVPAASAAFAALPSAGGGGGVLSAAAAAAVEAEVPGAEAVSCGGVRRACAISKEIGGGAAFPGVPRRLW